MGSWFVKPQTIRLEIGDEGDRQWIEVKKRLTVGEERLALARLVSDIREDGRVMPDLKMLGKSEAMAYLVEWSLRDDDGQPIRIDSEAKVAAALDLLDPDHFKMISIAIEHHVAAMTAERVMEKNALRGTTSSASIS